MTQTKPNHVESSITINQEYIGWRCETKKEWNPQVTGVK